MPRLAAQPAYLCYTAYSIFLIELLFLYVSTLLDQRHLAPDVDQAVRDTKGSLVLYAGAILDVHPHIYAAEVITKNVVTSAVLLSYGRSPDMAAVFGPLQLSALTTAMPSRRSQAHPGGRTHQQRRLL